MLVDFCKNSPISNKNEQTLIDPHLQTGVRSDRSGEAKQPKFRNFLYNVRQAASMRLLAGGIIAATLRVRCKGVEH
jgi:hypothetical protein